MLDSISTWQLCRTARNLAAHDYEIEYAEIADHFNTVHELQAMLFRVSGRLMESCITDLGINPQSDDFTPEFSRIVIEFSAQ